MILEVFITFNKTVSKLCNDTIKIRVPREKGLQ